MNTTKEMAQCYKCKIGLKGEWEITESKLEFKNYGRFLGVNAWFVSDEAKWVYCYCEKCFKELVCFGPSLKDKDKKIQQLADEKNNATENLHKKISVLEENIKVLSREMNSLKKERDTFKHECETKQRQLTEQRHIYQQAKNNIYSLPEVSELIKIMNEIPKEDLLFLTESGLNCDVIKMVEEKQRLLTLEVTSSFRRDISTHIEAQVVKLTHSLRAMNEFIRTLEHTLAGAPSFQQEMIQTTRNRITEEERRISKWCFYKARFSKV
eukprot:TRINITY_DN7619_c0_g1_i2.p1 TRINITY_DN7619_c0_g1~~TRINITY_DN7619_c0_g1_i2.p1  ORF type:complete len:267 (-),score=48.66 TRINITY_DN7619_c0_g1_i2:194-994(-)